LDKWNKAISWSNKILRLGFDAVCKNILEKTILLNTMKIKFLMDLFKKLKRVTLHVKNILSPQIFQNIYPIIKVVENNHELTTN